MSEEVIENSEMMNIFLYDMKDIFTPTNIDNISNESNIESKEDLPSKQPIKFILTKQESPSASFLQKKTILKSNDSSSDNENSNNGRWTKEEQNRFAEAVLKFGNDWKNIQNHVSSRNITQVRSHAQKFLMKLKENNFLINKGMDQYLSWTKIMNFLNQNLTYNELKEVLFSVEQAGQKKIGIKKYKNIKKMNNQNKKKDNIENQFSEENNYIISNGTNENIHLYGKYFLNLEEEEANYNIKNKMIKEEEDEKELQKFIECFNSSKGEITLNSSFEENSKKDDEEEDKFNNINKLNYKLNRFF